MDYLGNVNFCSRQTNFFCSDSRSVFKIKAEKIFLKLLNKEPYSAENVKMIFLRIFHSVLLYPFLICWFIFHMCGIVCSTTFEVLIYWHIESIFNWNKYFYPIDTRSSTLWSFLLLFFYFFSNIFSLFAFLNWKLMFFKIFKFIY